MTSVAEQKTTGVATMAAEASLVASTKSVADHITTDEVIRLTDEVESTLVKGAISALPVKAGWCNGTILHQYRGGCLRRAAADRGSPDG